MTKVKRFKRRCFTRCVRLVKKSKKMNRWVGKIAVITGASSGIGLVLAQAFIREGLIVVSVARRKTKMEEGMKGVKGPGRFYAKECDVTKAQDVIDTFYWIKKTLGTVHILINNAVILLEKSIEDASIETIQFIVNVNLMGVLYCTKEALKLMKANDEECQIVNMNSIAGVRTLRMPGKCFNVYSTTKHGLRSLSETLNHELLNTKIRVNNFSPGIVRTDIFDKAEMDSNFLNIVPSLTSEDIANSIMHVIGAPAHVEITELTIKPKGEFI